MNSKVVFSGKGYSILSRGGSLYIIANEKGRIRLYESLHTKQITEAKSRAADRYKIWLREEEKPALRTRLIEDVWKEYIKREEAKVKIQKLDEATLVRKKSVWKRIKFFWSGLTPREITEDNWDIFCAEMEVRHPKCSMQPELKYVLAIANFSFKKKLIDEVPKLELSKVKEKPITERRALSHDELRELLKAANDPEVTDWVGQLLVHCGVYHGMRISEISKMEKDNLIWIDESLYLKLVDTKTDEDRTIRVAKPVVPLIQAAFERAKGKYLLPLKKNADKPIHVQTLEKRWYEVLEASRVDAFFHELRHTAITAAVNKYELVKVSLYFGVSVKTLLKHYVHLDEKAIGVVSDAVNDALLLQQICNKSAGKTTVFAGQISKVLDGNTEDQNDSKQQ